MEGLLQRAMCSASSGSRVQQYAPKKRVAGLCARAVGAAAPSHEEARARPAGDVCKNRARLRLCADGRNLCDARRRPKTRAGPMRTRSRQMRAAMRACLILCDRKDSQPAFADGRERGDREGGAHQGEGRARPSEESPIVGKVVGDLVEVLHRLGVVGHLLSRLPSQHPVLRAARPERWHTDWLRMRRLNQSLPADRTTQSPLHRYNGQTYVHFCIDALLPARRMYDPY